MKILFCTNSFERIDNGPAKFANILLHLNQLFSEHELRILTEDVSSDKADVYKVTLRIPIILNIFSQFFRMFKYHNQAIKIKKEFNFDVLVYNNSLIGLWSAIKLPGTVGMINDNNNSSVNFRNFNFNYMFFKRIIFKQFERLSVKFHNKIITNSDYLSTHLMTVYSGIEKKIFRLYKAIELPGENNLRRHINSNPISILFVKADFERGGLEDLVKALSHLNYQFKCIIIGPEIRFKKRIYNYFRGIKNIVPEFYGPKSPGFVQSIMNKSDLFCTPARREALGVANLEAISIGLPVISTNVGGIPEILDHENNGWLAEPHNPKSLANSIRSCIENDEERKEKIINGIAYSKKFSKELVLNNFLNILLNGKS